MEELTTGHFESENKTELIDKIMTVLSIVAGIGGYYIFKTIYTTPVVVAVIAVVAMFTVFNTSFWFWAALYTMLSLLSGLCVKLIASNKQSRYFG